MQESQISVPHQHPHQPTQYRQVHRNEGTTPGRYPDLRILRESTHLNKIEEIVPQRNQDNQAT